ncbi:putative phosphoribosylformylglycinamidine synthase [Tannerella forsythia 92A2]|uniref:Phosphoribosylformylglycinamidine synthase n=1 Tax=Tannerella forsythia (strain ATCC 43037 / JCM 10827 / CCUG 21028 A / KCTC 5666 / FDC 338) TaxID=203275 RepID=G8UQ77_TANFA|nr:phosphoribosylformylglycinamidine synthase [Tannerella forsythia]AEW22001.1 putative phosphoribosylformylglycinamidine synthase [Tannerella forsythia 92A2]
MIQFFQSSDKSVLAVETSHTFSKNDIEKLIWLFSGATPVEADVVKGRFVGPRREMITPWSTNAVEITQNMGLEGIARIEEYVPLSPEKGHDPMLQHVYDNLDQQLFTIDRKPDPIVYIDDIAAYNEQEGLALSADEVGYLNEVSKKLKRNLTDSEVFGFSQVNSEHCRHKIFGGTFIIDGEEKEHSLFALIKKTSAENPNKLVSAYKDNVAFNAGPTVEQFAPLSADKPDYFSIKKIDTVLSLKAETHNFPTTVEPFNGAATGTGGEIRDRLGGGKASLPIAGTAVYMTSYPRTEENRSWENILDPRRWLYQSPEQILIKASNGASDFGNKFGQPLICGSLLTYEHTENEKKYAYDKVIMLAGGVGYANKRDALKGDPKPKEKVVIIGGDNYRIGMGGGAVSSVDTGQYTSGIELNAVQRANPEMQKRAANVIRAIAESESNPIISIHDHGAGGHLNCLSELVEATGGHIDMSKLPVGDPTLSAKEIIGNESQERMGLLMKEKDVERVRRIAERERAPMYVVGQTTDDMKFVFEQQDGVRPIDIKLEYMFGKPPRTIMEDQTVDEAYSPVKYKEADLHRYLENVLQLEAVACKDWLTNKVDRSVTGKIARQQCQGELQLPLSDLGAVALDYRGQAGMATSIGHAPQVALIDPAAGSVMAIAEALTNIVFAPLADGLTSVSLSANWMWPCRNKGEDARLYKAVEAASDFACALGINIPTGKDSLSMTQKYGTDKVFSPGTVIISAAGEVSDIRKIVSPVLARDKHTYIYYIDFSFDALRLGGSAFAQSLGKVGSEAPTVRDFDYFRDAFNAVQEAIDKGLILAGHDISAGGMITALLEMCFANVEGGLEVDLNAIAEEDIVKILFAENPGVLVQVKEKSVFEKQMRAAGIGFARIARPTDERHLIVTKDDTTYHFGIDYMRDVWYKSSYLLDMRQSGNECAGNRYENYKMQPLEYKFHKDFVGTLASYKLTADRRKRSGVRAAILRDKGTNGEREMAYTLYLAGFDVKDVHLTDLASGRETLEDVNFIVFCGGFSNSDVLGSAKGWAAGILYNEKAKQAIDRFYARKDTMSLGICNGCQLMAELGLLYPEHEEKHKMRHNRSHKFESGFVGLDIPKNHSIMLGSLSGTKLGVWIAHGEGRFEFPYDEKQYHIVAKYSYDGYPANPNGSPWAVAGVCSADGRHLAMMPHPERSIFPWQCGYYPADRLGDDVTPWIEAFLNARRWIEAH